MGDKLATGPGCTPSGNGADGFHPWDVQDITPSHAPITDTITKVAGTPEKSLKKLTITNRNN